MQIHLCDGSSSHCVHTKCMLPSCEIENESAFSCEYGNCWQECCDWISLSTWNQWKMERPEKRRGKKKKMAKLFRRVCGVLVRLCDYNRFDFNKDIVVAAATRSTGRMTSKLLCTNKQKWQPKEEMCFPVLFGLVALMREQLIDFRLHFSRGSTENARKICVSNFTGLIHAKCRHQLNEDEGKNMNKWKQYSFGWAIHCGTGDVAKTNRIVENWHVSRDEVIGRHERR